MAGNQSHPERGQRHHRDGSQEDPAPSVAITVVAEDDAADRAREIAGREGGKRGHERGERRTGRENRGGDVGCEDAEDDEVVELERAPKTREQYDAPAGAGQSLRCAGRRRRSTNGHGERLYRSGAAHGPFGGKQSRDRFRPPARNCCVSLCDVDLACRAPSDGSPYEAVLGPAFASLHPHVRCAHLPPLRATGTMDVEHGTGWLTTPMIWLMKLPAAGARQQVQLEVHQDGSELRWTRRIGRSVLETRQRARGLCLVERSGLGRVSFDLSVEGGALLYRQSSIHVAGLRLRSSLSPRVDAVVSPMREGWTVAVTVSWRGQMICRYAGAIHAI